MKKTFTIFMAVIMIVTFIPTIAFADGGTSGETCTVTFDMNGREGNGVSPSQQTVSKGSKIQEPASPSADEVFDGYNFLSWYYRNEDNQRVSGILTKIPYSPILRCMPTGWIILLST